MENRIKQIREYFELNQREFSKRINIGQSTLALFETGNRAPKDIHIKRICDEFGVNEIWLRTGEGGEDNMFAHIENDDRFSINLGKLGKTENEFIRNGINLLAETEPETLKILEDFMKAWVGIK